MRTTLRAFSILIFIASAGSAFIFPASIPGIGTFTAWAREEEDDENEREEEYEDRSDEDDYVPTETTTTAPVTSTPKKEKVVVPAKTIQTIVSQPVVETYIETDPGYASDGDGDGLVDALDPDPAIAQTAYFTDDDGDSVPNALDNWAGVDDLLVIDPAADTNQNGILDSHERL
ncbi:MAG: hypothetical protein ACEQSB_05015 [Undibacterium sp.]